MIGWHPWIKKRVSYLSYIKGNGDGKDIHCSAQNAALFVDLLKKKSDSCLSSIYSMISLLGMEDSSAFTIIKLKVLN